MTLPEYLYRMKAYSLSRVDEEYDMHLQAWLHRDINSTKKQGQKEVYAYQSFKDFFDYQKRIDDIEKPKIASLDQKSKEMARIAAQVNSERR